MSVQIRKSKQPTENGIYLYSRRGISRWTHVVRVDGNAPFLKVSYVLSIESVNWGNASDTFKDHILSGVEGGDWSERIDLTTLPMLLEEK